MDKLKRLVLISRPIFYIPFMAVFWWGVQTAGNHHDFYTWLGLLFFSFPMGLLVFGVNDLADREADARNPRKGGIEGAIVDSREARLISLGIFSVIVLYAIIFLMGGRYWSLLALAYVGLFALIYSVKPFRLKNRPGLDALSNGLWVLAPFIAGVFVAGGRHWPAYAGLYSLIAFLTGVAFHSLGTVLDYTADKRSRQLTLGTYLGKRQTATLSLLILSVCFALSFSTTTNLRFLLGICAILNFTICLNPSDAYIRRLTTIFYWVIAPLPAVFILSRAM